MFLRYKELRVLLGDPSHVRRASVVSERAGRARAAFAVRPPEWLGTATEAAARRSRT